MGTTTYFKGEFKLNRPLDASTKALIDKLTTSRRIARHVNPFKYGLQGELFIANHSHNDSADEGMVSYNAPPNAQAGLWCQWKTNDAGTAILWDGGEKFYYSAHWIRYILQRILIPRGYELAGIVNAKTEDDDRYHIIVNGGKVNVVEGFHEDVPKPRIMRGY